MLQGKTKTNKTQWNLSPQIRRLQTFSLNILGFAEYVISVTPLKHCHDGMKAATDKSETNESPWKTLVTKTLFTKLYLQKQVWIWTSPGGSIQPWRTGLPTKTSFLPVAMLCGHAKAWEITFLGGSGHLMWYTWWEEPTHQKSPWCWERLKAKGEEGVRGWDGWTASPTQGTWTWANSGRQWGTGWPGALQRMGSHRESDTT